MNIANALKIDGWMRPEELTWLAEQASSRRRICEVGSWMGRSTRAIVDNAPDDAHVYAVDTWMGSDEQVHRQLLAGKPMSPNAEKPGENWLMDKFQANFPEAYFKTPHKLRPYQGTSSAGADYLGNHYGIKFEMIFLDASHDYENVRADILAWQSHLAPDGLMCGHDYGASFPGVRQAVDEIYGIPKRPQGWKVGQGSIWAIM